MKLETILTVAALVAAAYALARLTDARGAGAAVQSVPRSSVTGGGGTWGNGVMILDGPLASAGAEWE